MQICALQVNIVPTSDPNAEVSLAKSNVVQASLTSHRLAAEHASLGRHPSLNVKGILRIQRGSADMGILQPYPILRGAPA